MSSDNYFSPESIAPQKKRPHVALILITVVSFLIVGGIIFFTLIQGGGNTPFRNGQLQQWKAPTSNPPPPMVRTSPSVTDTPSEVTVLENELTP